MNNSSYRDPDGFVYYEDRNYYRFLSKKYVFNHYTTLIKSGLYDKLIKQKLLVEHQELEINHLERNDWGLTLLPMQIPFISQPSEWSFDMFKDAALLTLSIQQKAIEEGMILKDATPYNVQFYNGKPIFIDTSSFEKNDFSKPWIAYRQFCECFLAPILLMKYMGQEIGKIMECYPNGIPLEIVVKMLPWKAKLNFAIYLHIFLHQKYKATHVTKQENKEKKIGAFSKSKILSIVEHLYNLIEGLKLNVRVDKNWDNYYSSTILGNNYITNKEQIIKSYLEAITFETSLDLGCNNGFFSKILSSNSKFTIACDFDRICVNDLYQYCKKSNIQNIIPLCIDLAVPTPSIGFLNQERLSFLKRTKVDLLVGLALIHHLRIANNIPIKNIIQLFLKLTNKYVLIEFIDKKDEKVRELLATREDIFLDYTLANFEEEIIKYFKILRKNELLEANRTLYLLELNEN